MFLEMANVNSLLRQECSEDPVIEVFDSVDTYLSEHFQVNLEQVLVDASVDRMARELAGIIDIACRETGCFQCSDGGKIYLYEGALIVTDVAYQYRAWIYEDRGGKRSITDLREFAVFNWRDRKGVLYGGLERLMLLRPSLYSDKKLN
jgi:hypothetical protein